MPKNIYHVIKVLRDNLKWHLQVTSVEDSGSKVDGVLKRKGFEVAKKKCFCPQP